MRLNLAPLVLAAVVSGCALPQPPVEVPRTYVLDARLASAAPRPRRDLVLAVSVPRARSGFDTPQMAYVRRAHELDYYVKHQWADTPPRMLAPLLAQALELSGAFRAVVQASGALSADLRLDVAVVRLLQDFSEHPSRVRFTLHAQLIDVSSRRVVATREFDEIEIAPSEDAYGGVIAANRALERLLGRVADLCAEQAVHR